MAAELSRLTMNEVVAVISAITALCAVLLGPLVSLWAANKQARISLRSNNRQAWINSLRDALSEFSSTARVVALSKEFEDKYSRAEKLFFLEEKIKLLLNPKEEDHKNLIASIIRSRKSSIAIFAAGDNIDKKQLAHDNLKDALDNVTKSAQPILKREWERVKIAD